MRPVLTKCALSYVKPRQSASLTAVKATHPQHGHKRNIEIHAGGDAMRRHAYVHAMLTGGIVAAGIFYFGSTVSGQAQAAARQAGPCRYRETQDHAGRSVPAEPRYARRQDHRTAGHQARRSRAQQGGVRQGEPDLFRALRRLSRRAAQGRDRKAADARSDQEARLRLSARLHHLRLARRNAELGHLRRPSAGRHRVDGALSAQRPGAAAGIRPQGDQGELESPDPGRTAADQEDEQARHRQPVLR